VALAALEGRGGGFPPARSMISEAPSAERGSPARAGGAPWTRVQCAGGEAQACAPAADGCSNAPSVKRRKLMLLILIPAAWLSISIMILAVCV